MPHSINCIYNDRGVWYTNIRVKKSLFGFVTRLCLEYGSKNCKYQVPFTKPINPPTKK